MDKELYKSSFKNINVSEKAVNEVITKACLLQDVKSRKNRKRLKLYIPVAAILAVSIITVSAAPRLDIYNVFKSFYNEVFNIDIDRSQQDYFEKNSIVPAEKFLVKDGVTMDIEGILADNNFVFAKYLISAKDKAAFESFDLSTVPKLYVGKMTKGNLPSSSLSVQGDQDPAQPYQHSKPVIYAIAMDKSTAGQTATLVLKDPLIDQPISIDLADTYKKYAVPVECSNDTYNIPDSNLNLPFNNEFGGKILLDSIGYVDSKLVLAIDSSNYYDIPRIFLRNKITNKIYYSCDNQVDIYSYNIENINMLRDLEIIMPMEYHFSFKLPADSTKDVDISKQAPLVINDFKISKVKISPISFSIFGTSDGHAKSFDGNTRCSIRLKDKTVLSNFGVNGSVDDNSFISSFYFKNPMSPESIDAIIIRSGDDVVEIPVKLK
jgi:hypothetical protein